MRNRSTSFVAMLTIFPDDAVAVVVLVEELLFLSVEEGNNCSVADRVEAERFFIDGSNASDAILHSFPPRPKENMVMLH